LPYLTRLKRDGLKLADEYLTGHAVEAIEHYRIFLEGILQQIRSLAP